MKLHRHLLCLAPALLTACGGGGSLALSVTSDDAQTLSVGALGGVDLTTVKSVQVTVSEVWVHVDGDEAKEDVKGESVEDTSTGWQRVSTEETTLDLMTVRNQSTLPLGEMTVPEGKVTQIRLQLKGNSEGEQMRLVGAVVDADDTVCDLLVPQSAFKPGLKISGDYKAMAVENGGKHAAVLNFQLKDSAKLAGIGAGCSYRLNPVLKLKKYDATKDVQ